MSLNKAIKYGKEYRKPYTNSKAFDRSCRNHGNCGWCENTRTYNRRKTEEAAEQILKEFKQFGE